MFFSGAPCRVGAHEISPAIATLEATSGGSVRIDIILDLEAAIAGIAPGHEATLTNAASNRYKQLRLMSPGEIRGVFDGTAEQLLSRISLFSVIGVQEVSQADAIRLILIDLEVPEVGNPELPRRSKLILDTTLNHLNNPLFWRLDPLFGDSVVRVRDPVSKQILGAQLISTGQTSSPIFLQQGQPTQLQEGSWTDVFTRYLVIGFQHILPLGTDHILFIVGLFLLSSRVAPLLLQITAFTVAHTLSLALSMLDVIRLSPSVVEPLIALSIVYVAIENILTNRIRTWRIAIVFAFGLLHGLGFAGLLQDIGVAPGRFMTSLIAFNVGVEFGQLAVVAICFLAVAWWAQRTWYRSRIVIPASSAIALIGAFWVFERLG